MIQVINLSLTEQQNAALNAEIQRVVNIAMAAQDAWGNWMNQSSGYHLVTNFYQDFHIAEMCGNAIEDIRDTYNRDFNEAKQNGVTFLAEFVMVLQTKCNVYYDGAQRAKNEGSDHTKYQQIHELYYNLYNEANDWCWDNLNEEDRNTYYQITD